MKTESELRNEIERLNNLNSELVMQSTRDATRADLNARELAEAQQWIDSEPDWKDKYGAEMSRVLKERDQYETWGEREIALLKGNLEEAIREHERMAEMNAALRNAVNEIRSVNHNEFGCVSDSRIEAIICGLDIILKTIL